MLRISLVSPIFRLMLHFTLVGFCSVNAKTPLTKQQSNLTPLGANAQHDTEYNIPIYKKQMVTLEKNHRLLQEKPLYKIDSTNFKAYAVLLSQGLQALLQRFPSSFYLSVYPTHRLYQDSPVVNQRTQLNAKHTTLVNGIDGLRSYAGGIPFLIPENGAEIIWNGRLASIYPSLEATFDELAIFQNGKRQLRRQHIISEYPFAYDSHAEGAVDEAISMNAAYIMVNVLLPERQKGQRTVIHEALDQVEHERKAWIYMPGTRRVRRAPTVGYDTPDGPAGLVTIDDAMGFNGAMDRFDWQFIDKKPMIIPYHNRQFDDDSLDFDSLLLRSHPNPDYMRYEVHRVWIVEATLKPNARHIYGKRRFYLDEDTWQIVLVENYDTRGKLWRVGLLNTDYSPQLKRYIPRAQTFIDLQAGAYLTQRLINQTAPESFSTVPKGAQFYTPANLRKLGLR